MTDNAVRLTYQQYRAVRRLVHDCCNYQDGNCLLLDDGEECVCPQSISYSLICRWFRAAVLPLDENLCAALLHRRERKSVSCAAAGTSQNQPGQILPGVRQGGRTPQNP